jgi:hypothetical protein
MPWWLMPTESRENPKSVPVFLLGLSGLLFLLNLWDLYRHFAGIERLETRSLVMDIIGAVVFAGLSVFWARMAFSARIRRGGDPPPPVSNS